MVEQCGPIGRIGRRLWGNEKRGTKLRGLRAKRKHGSDTRAIHDPSGGDDWQRRFAHQQPDECHGPEQLVWRSGIERAAVASGFGALRNDRIDSRIGHPARFIR
ncbi:MAG: hypothetical protein QOF74_7576, partial [Caballeronia mineralivorans]|nr:hypothetical protein [Caballeronia mineralivorans]